MLRTIQKVDFSQHMNVLQIVNFFYDTHTLNLYYYLQNPSSDLWGCLLTPWEISFVADKGNLKRIVLVTHCMHCASIEKYLMLAKSSARRSHTFSIISLAGNYLQFISIRSKTKMPKFKILCTTEKFNCRRREEGISTLEQSVICRWAIRSDVVGGRAWNRFSVVFVDAPAVAGRLVALRRTVFSVRPTLRNKYPPFRIHAIHLLRIPSLLCAI